MKLKNFEIVWNFVAWLISSLLVAFILGVISRMGIRVSVVSLIECWGMMSGFLSFLMAMLTSLPRGYLITLLLFLLARIMRRINQNLKVL